MRTSESGSEGRSISNQKKLPQKTKISPVNRSREQHVVLSSKKSTPDSAKPDTLKSARNSAQLETDLEKIYSIMDAIQTSMEKAKSAELNELKKELSIWQQRAEELKKIAEPAKLRAETEKIIRELDEILSSIPTQEPKSEPGSEPTSEKTGVTFDVDRLVGHQPFKHQLDLASTQNLEPDFAETAETESIPTKEMFLDTPPKIRMPIKEIPLSFQPTKIGSVENAITDKKLNPDDFLTESSTPPKGESYEEILRRGRPIRGWLKGLFGPIINPPLNLPPTESARQKSISTQSTPKKTTGFLSSLANSNLAKWGQRLSVLGIFSRWAGPAQEIQSPEPIKFGVPTEQTAELKTASKATEGPNELLQQILNEKIQRNQEKIAEIGTVGSDKQHNGLLLILENQLKNKPSLKDFGFKGDQKNVQEVTKWAKGLAETLVQKADLLDKGLNAKAINNLVIDAQLDSSGQPNIYFFNADGSPLENPANFFYHYENNDKKIAKLTSQTKSLDPWATAEQSIVQERTSHHNLLEKEVAKLDAVTLQELSTPYTNYEQAFKAWQNTLTETPEATTLNFLESHLDQATQNLETELETKKLENQHEKFLAEFKSFDHVRSSSARDFYARAYDKWHQSLNEPTNSLDAPDPTNYLKRRVVVAGEILESLLDAELADQEIFTRINQLKHPSKDLQRDYATYLANYFSAIEDEPNEAQMEKLKNKRIAVQLLLETENL